MKQPFTEPFKWICGQVIGWILLLWLGPLASQAQAPTQLVRGRVYSSDQLRPLAGASVTLVGTALGTTTDEQGRFRLPAVPVGRYQLTVSYVGYEPTVMNELLVESGKEQVVEVRLQPGATQLGEATVKGNRPDRGISAENITAEQVLRLPATYLDPARLATAYAGVVNTNDQANNISVRGNSPNSLIWRLEGVEIVNPNHLSNAGTIGDRPTASGGGVNILSAQLLGTTRVLTGAFPAEYGNTTAGVMDMSLRAGNNERHEFTAQAGLIGLDVAAEGPLSKRTGSSYLVNYRYSFTGLLGLMGISFGGEDIRFQDLSFNLVFPTRQGGRFTVFGVGGNSSNDFNARPQAEQEVDKDRYDIIYKSRMGSAGLTFTQPLGQRWLWRSTLVTSANRNTRDQMRALSDSVRIAATSFGSDGRHTWFNSLSYRLSEQHRFTAGLYVVRWYGASFGFNGPMNVVQSDYNYYKTNYRKAAWQIEPYLNYQWQPIKQVTVDAGLHVNRFTLNTASHSLEPRASVRWAVRPGHTLSFAYGRHSQIQQASTYLVNSYSPDHPLLNNPNNSLGLTKADHWVLNYTRQLNSASYLKAEVYWQGLFNVPVANRGFSMNGEIFTGFSVLNQIDLLPPGQNWVALANAGRGRNRGVELTYQKYLSKNYYVLASGSLYEAQYQLADGIWRKSRFDGRFATNLTGGKEWSLSRKSNNQTWGLNGRVSYLGGFRDRPVDAVSSQTSGATVYSSADYTVQLPNFFRTDVRVYWRKSKTRYNRMLALDLQNLTNARNVAYSYFDALQGKVVRQYQLGTLPILSYRWEF